MVRIIDSLPPGGGTFGHSDGHFTIESTSTKRLESDDYLVKVSPSIRLVS